MDALIAWFWALVIFAAFVGVVALIVIGLRKLERKLIRQEKRASIERYMRDQIEDAEIEREVAQKILRENGQYR